MSALTPKDTDVDMDGTMTLAHEDYAGLVAAIGRKYQGGPNPEVIKLTVTPKKPECYVSLLLVSAKDQWGKTYTEALHYVINNDEHQDPLTRTSATVHFGSELDHFDAPIISISDKHRNNLDIQQQGGLRTLNATYLNTSKPFSNVPMKVAIQNLAAILSSRSGITAIATLLDEDTNNVDKNQVHTTFCAYVNTELGNDGLILPEFMKSVLSDITDASLPMTKDQYNDCKLCIVHNKGSVESHFQTDSVSDMMTRTSPLENAKIASVLMLALGITDEHANNGVYYYVMNLINFDTVKRIKFLRSGTLSKANFCVVMSVSQELMFLTAGFPPARRGSDDSPEHFAKLVAAGRFPEEFSEILRTTLVAFNKDAMSLPVLDFFSKSSIAKKRKGPMLDEASASADASSLGF